MTNISNNKIMSSLLSFKEFILTNDINITDDWGWFIDIEKNIDIIRKPCQQFIKKPYCNKVNKMRYTRSLNSFDDLLEENGKNNDNKHCLLYNHSLGFIGLIIYYYFAYLYK